MPCTPSNQSSQRIYSIFPSNGRRPSPAACTFRLEPCTLIYATCSMLLGHSGQLTTDNQPSASSSSLKDAQLRCPKGSTNMEGNQLALLEKRLNPGGDGGLKVEDGSIHLPLPCQLESTLRPRRREVNRSLEGTLDTRGLEVAPLDRQCSLSQFHCRIQLHLIETLDLEIRRIDRPTPLPKLYF